MYSGKDYIRLVVSNKSPAGPSILMEKEGGEFLCVLGSKGYIVRPCLKFPVGPVDWSSFVRVLTSNPSTLET